MPDQEPLAERAEREVDALKTLWKKRPFLFSIIILVLIILMVFFIYDRFLGIPKLKEIIQEKDKEIQRLETQLTPFRTIALERYPGNEAEALERLSKEVSDLDAKLEASIKKINSFEAEVAIRFEGDWTKGFIPVTPGIMVLGEGIASEIVFRNRDGSARAAKLHLVEGMPRISEVKGEAELTYSMRAKPGSWILGSQLDQLMGCEEIKLGAFGLRHQMTKTGRIRLLSFTINFFINGELAFTLSEKSNKDILIPEITRGVPELHFKYKDYKSFLQTR